MGLREGERKITVLVLWQRLGSLINIKGKMQLDMIKGVPRILNAVKFHSASWGDVTPNVWFGA